MPLTDIWVDDVGITATGTRGAIYEARFPIIWQSDQIEYSYWLPEC
jgi:hypothetical protein